ncbi:MAG: replication initiation factor domain-containing protein [Betaproteobacteria bacterium]
MFSGSVSGQDESAAGAQPRSGAPAAPAPESRLVIRDEREQGEESLASDESPSQIDKDYESEIYRVESRGGRGVIVAYPVPLAAANPYCALIDWCAFTVRPSQFKTHHWVMRELARLFGFDKITPRATGLYGYKHSAIIEEGGLIAWGGKNQRNTVYVSLNGQGCARVSDWSQLRAWCECHGAKLTRVDLAHDDFEGKTVTIERAKAWYDAGGFNAGGRKPETKTAGDWWGGKKGRTVYIGDRAYGKVARFYEKGKQQGDPESPWTRVEVEWHNKDRKLPLDMLTRPAAYLAGAYPCLRFLSAEQCKLKTIRKAARTSLKKAVEVVRNQYGKLFHVMMQVHGGDAAAVVKALARPGVPARLEPYSYHLRTDPALVYSLDAGDESDAAVVA